MVMGRMTEVLRNCLGVGEGGWEGTKENRGWAEPAEIQEIQETR